MQLHQLSPIHKKKTQKRIGRGGKKGFTSGRGSKGQRARSGRRLKPIIRELIKRYPKLRGHRAIVLPRFEVMVKLGVLDKFFREGETVNPAVLLARNVVSFPGRKIPRVKILGDGELTKPLVFEKCFFSTLARKKVEKSGSTIKEKTNVVSKAAPVI